MESFHAAAYQLISHGCATMRMSEEPRAKSPQVSRRRLLQTVSGAAVIGSLGAKAATPVAADNGEQEWVFETGDEVRSSPTIVDGTVFVGSYDNNLYAVDAETGTEEWVFETGDEVRSSPTVVDGTVFVGSADGNLYAVDAETGTEEWVFETGDEVRSSPTVVDGILFVGSFDNNLYAVDAETGDEVWAFEANDTIASSPAVADGTVFVGSGFRAPVNDTNLYAVNAATGDEEWAFEANNVIISSPTVADGTVFVGSNDWSFYAIDAETGNQEWSFTREPSIFTASPTVSDGTVFIGGSDLHAFDAETGDEVWTFESVGPVESSPTVVDETIFVGTNNLHAVDVETGTEEWVFETDNRVHSSPAVVDGIAFVGSSGGNLYAVDGGVAGSSEGSRAMLGTLGHHDEWRYDEQTITINDGRVLTQFIPGSGAADSSLLVGGGVATVGVGYLAYKKLQEYDESSTDPTPTTPSSEDSISSSESSISPLSVNQYDELNLGDTIKQYPTTEIRQATTAGHPVWVLTPTSNDETIDTTQLEQFSAEVAPWASMDEHEHLLSVYGHGDEPLPWVAVEPADGPRIQDKTAELETKEAIELVIQACEAVHHVQRYGLTYEHLSPESVLIEDTRATLRGVVDQVIGERYSYRLPDPEENPTAEQADVYRLGALAYQVLTDSESDQLSPALPSNHNTSLPATLDKVLITALAEAPEDRYETVLHLRDELEDQFDQV